ncbi:MAG: CBS domain-containing protein, partial [Chthoniobacterales bacterium]
MEISTPIRSILARKGMEVWSILPNDTVFDAIALMAQYDVGALPVMKDGRLLGMISERDYTRKVILLGRSSRMTDVADIMTQDLIVVEPGDSVHDCMQLMTENR